MSSPVSFGDIIKALELINWIRNNCFNPANNAQAKFREFKREIEDLEPRLRAFRDAFELSVSYVCGDLGLLDARQQQAVLKQEADKLIGDFLATLQECQQLLSSQNKLERKKGTIFDSASWAASTQGQVDDLRRRIQAHASKITMFLEPVRMRLDSDVVANTHDILEILNEHTGRNKRTKLPAIPPSLDVKFQQALSRHNTIAITHPRKLPLQEGVKIMVLHYRQSTALASNSPSGQTALNILPLLKAHWLVETLMNSDALKQTRPGDYHQRVVKHVKEGIAAQYQHGGVTRYSEEELCTLEASAFELWPQPVVIEEPSLTAPGPEEELLARVPIVSPSNERKELYVFRFDDQTLRIVYVRGVRETERFFNLLTDSLVPFYTITSGERTEWSMDLFYGSGAAQTNYPLQSRADAFQLQQAFTGYCTTIHSEGVYFAVTHKRSWREGLRDGLRGSVGEVQIWEWPVPNITPALPNSPRMPYGNSTVGSTFSGSSYSKASWTFRETDPSIVSVSEAESGKTVVVAGLPPSPLIMAFTQDARTYSFWQIRLDDIEIRKSHPGRQDQRIQFEPKLPAKTFTARVLTVLKHDLRSWNLNALFQDPPSQNLEGIDCTHLTLSFPTLEAKDDFELEFFPILTTRLSQLNKQEAARGIAKREARRPTMVKHYESPASPRKDSHSGGLRFGSFSRATLHRSSTAPQLEPLSPLPAISLGKDPKFG